MRCFNLAEVEEDPDCDFHITPLHSAAAVHASRPAVLDLLLSLRADVGGYHFKSFEEDGLTCERETLLSRAVRLRQNAVVEKLLRAKTDPNEIGYELNSHGDERGGGEEVRPPARRAGRFCAADAGTPRGRRRAG